MNKDKKAEIIEKASILLLKSSKEEAIDIINNDYKFEYKKIEKRSYQEKEKFKIFIELVEKDIALLGDNYIKRWYSISKSFIDKD